MLTEAQRTVLRILSQRGARDAHASGPEISRIARRRFDDWSRGKLIALEKRGLVERTGTTFSNAQCWCITPAGRAALTTEGRDG